MSQFWSKFLRHTSVLLKCRESTFHPNISGGRIFHSSQRLYSSPVSFTKSCGDVYHHNVDFKIPTINEFSDCTTFLSHVYNFLYNRFRSTVTQQLNDGKNLDLQNFSLNLSSDQLNDLRDSLIDSLPTSVENPPTLAASRVDAFVLEVLKRCVFVQETPRNKEEVIISIYYKLFFVQLYHKSILTQKYNINDISHTNFTQQAKLSSQLLGIISLLPTPLKGDSNSESTIQKSLKLQINKICSELMTEAFNRHTWIVRNIPTSVISNTLANGIMCCAPSQNDWRLYLNYFVNRERPTDTVDVRIAYANMTLRAIGEFDMSLAHKLADQLIYANGHDSLRSQMVECCKGEEILFQYLLNKSFDHKCITFIDDLFQLYSKYGRWLPREVSKIVFDLGLTIHPTFKGRMISIDRSGKCKRCGKNVNSHSDDDGDTNYPSTYMSKINPSLVLSDKDVLNLRREFIKCVFDFDSPSWSKSSDDEMKRFTLQLKRMGHYKVVVDGLNASHDKSGKIVNKQLIDFLRELHRYFPSNQDILVVHRHWIKKSPLFKQLQSLCKIILIDRSTCDDAYAILATLSRGKDTYIVSNDLFNQSYARLTDVEVSKLFSRWQINRQIKHKILHGEGSNPSVIFRLPVDHDARAKRMIDGTWALPLENENIRSNSSLENRDKGQQIVMRSVDVEREGLADFRQMMTHKRKNQSALELPHNWMCVCRQYDSGKPKDSIRPKKYHMECR